MVQHFFFLVFLLRSPFFSEDSNFNFNQKKGVGKLFSKILETTLLLTPNQNTRLQGESITGKDLWITDTLTFVSV